MQYNSLREKIRAEKEERQAKYAEFSRVWSIACAKGQLAGEECKPTPMRVQGDPNVYHDGMCGFAWVQMKGNTAFARWATKNGHFSKTYSGGVSHWISAFNQSYERKQACAKAMVEVLRENGIECYAGSRLD